MWPTTTEGHEDARNPSRAVFEHTADAYTRALLDAVPHFYPHGQPVGKVAVAG